VENPYAQVYGLTGVIGSGKSTAAKMLQEMGASLLDADEIARYVVNPTAPYYKEIREKIENAWQEYSPEPLFSNSGVLNRARLGSITFGDPDRVLQLNSIMHPPIQEEFKRRLKNIGEGKLVIYDVPLLFETGLNKRVKATILVYAPEKVCVARTLKRAHDAKVPLTEEEVYARLNAQISIEEKRSLADYIIDNSGTVDKLKEEVSRVYQKLVSL